MLEVVLTLPRKYNARVRVFGPGWQDSLIVRSDEQIKGLGAAKRQAFRIFRTWAGEVSYQAIKLEAALNAKP